MAGGQKAATQLIDRLEDNEKVKSNKLTQIISENCQLYEAQLEQVVCEIIKNEHILYQQIIKMFLEKDEKTLEIMDQYVDKISDPFCQLLNNLPSVEDDFLSDEVQMAERKIKQLSEDNMAINNQLNVAMNTIEEMSAEYTRVFSGTQSELELENSKQTMLKIFETAKKQVKLSLNDL